MVLWERRQEAGPWGRDMGSPLGATIGAKAGFAEDIHCGSDEMSATRAGKTRAATGHGDRGAKNDKTASRRLRRVHSIFLKKTGAGEGIRTLDPNLGKVVTILLICVRRCAFHPSNSLICKGLRALPIS